VANIDDLLLAAILGVLQAATEFLPVSSSGHLVLADELVGNAENDLTFDVALHLGTMIAVVAYFWRDWIMIIGSVLSDLMEYGWRITAWSRHSLLGVWVIIGTIPVVVVGLLFSSFIERELREPWIVGIMLIGFGIVIGALDRWGSTFLKLFEITLGRALAVGLVQVVALIPGVSRSGITIAAARGLGLDRPSAARFSFLLSTPAVLGASVLQFNKALTSEETMLWAPMAIGVIVAAVLGALVIRWLLAFLVRGTLMPFVWYRIGLGTLVLALSATDVI